MKNRAVLYTDVEGGYIKKMPFHIFESEIYKYRKIKITQQFCPVNGEVIPTPRITIRKLPVFALFFENGLVMDLRKGKLFTSRPYINDKEFIQDMLNVV